MAESEEELKSLLMRMKEESEKAGLKLSIQKTKIIAYGPITSWQIEEEKVEAVTDFILGGSTITVDSDCNHEIKTIASWKESCDQHRSVSLSVMSNSLVILEPRKIKSATGSTVSPSICH